MNVRNALMPTLFGSRNCGYALPEHRHRHRTCRAQILDCDRLSAYGFVHLDRIYVFGSQLSAPASFCPYGVVPGDRARDASYRICSLRKLVDASGPW